VSEFVLFFWWEKEGKRLIYNIWLSFSAGYLDNNNNKMIYAM